MPSDAASLHEQAQDLLDAAYAILSGTVGGAPKMQYLSPGLPALDYQCDQVAVWAAAIGDEQAGAVSPPPQVGQRRRLAWTNLCVLSCQATRCISTGTSTKTGWTPPKEAVLTSDAEKVMEDGWALWNGISTAILDEALFGGTCKDIKFVSMLPLTPQGGVAGWVLTVSFELAGYH